MGKMGFFDKSDLKFVGWNIVFAIVVTAIILIGLLIWLKGYTQHGVEVEVEDVRGLVADEAEMLLASQGLRMEVIDSTYSDKVPFGTATCSVPRPKPTTSRTRVPTGTFSPGAILTPLDLTSNTKSRKADGS